MNNLNQAAPPDATFTKVARKQASNPKRGPGEIAGKGRRTLIRAGLLSLILALALQAGHWSVRTFAHKRETAVAAAAIQAPRILITCPHHQHDCPADCLCPKTYTTVGADHESGAGAQDAGTDRGGSLREPSLAACTQHGPQSATAASDVFLAPPTVALSLPESGSPLLAMPAEPLRDGLSEPLLKIPI